MSVLAYGNVSHKSWGWKFLMGPAGERGTISPARRDKSVAGNRRSEGSETVPKGCRWRKLRYWRTGTA